MREISRAAAPVWDFSGVPGQWATAADEIFIFERVASLPWARYQYPGFFTHSINYTTTGPNGCMHNTYPARYDIHTSTREISRGYPRVNFMSSHLYHQIGSVI